MRMPITQSVAGVVVLFAGVWPYARHGRAQRAATCRGRRQAVHSCLESEMKTAWNRF
jgi:hypothetical protein